MKGGVIAVVVIGGLVNHCQGLGFYSEVNREPWGVFEEGNDMS